MRYAIYKEDLFYTNCPIYVLNDKTNCYEMNGEDSFYFQKEDVLGQKEFLLFQDSASAEGVRLSYQQVKSGC